MNTVLIEELKEKAYALADDIASLNDYLYSDAIKNISDEYVDILRKKQETSNGYFVALMARVEYLKHNNISL